MKHKFILSLIAITALLAGSLPAANPLPPDTKFQGVKNSLPANSTLLVSGTINMGVSSAIQSGTVTLGIPFHSTVTLTSAAAATPVSVLADGAVPAGKKVYVTGYFVKVNGSTDWATTTSVKIQDTNGTPVDFVTLTASALDGNEFHDATSDSATIENAMALGTGGTAAKGLRVVGNANGTGSNLVITVFGFIK